MFFLESWTYHHLVICNQLPEHTIRGKKRHKQKRQSKTCRTTPSNSENNSSLCCAMLYHPLGNKIEEILLILSIIISRSLFPKFQQWEVKSFLQSWFNYSFGRDVINGAFPPWEITGVSHTLGPILSAAKKNVLIFLKWGTYRCKHFI